LLSRYELWYPHFKTLMKKSCDLLFLCWLTGLALSLYFAAIPIDLWTQLWSGGAFIVALLLLRQCPQGVGRGLFLSLGAFLSVRYFFWRTTCTLPSQDLPSLFVGGALYLAEAYALIMNLLGIFVNIQPLNRQPAPLPADRAQLPTVDVFIPSYNEPAEMLEITLLAAMQIRYPRHKIAVYLLDDGGTNEKCTATETKQALAAQQRRASLQALCQRTGAHYLTRENNEHAKAGNLNAGLRQTHGELILVLDADHVPTVDILENTVGWFLRDPKMFVVQTPHFFISPNPLEKNLQTFEFMPGDSEMFYGVVQPGLDFWNASFFCGAAGVLRRQYLNEVGGFCGSTITEDAETALALHARGYHSAYLSRPMIAGLSPETFSGFVTQRTRWTQGMTQILLLKSPLLQKGLTFRQRLSYLNCTFFWLFPYARLVFLLAPSTYLLFGWHVYNATVLQGIAYAMPHIASVLLVNDYLFGKVRWTFVSEFYELIQSIFCLRAIGKVLLKPRAPKFLVTPKGEQLENDFISPLSGPFYLLLVTIVLAFIFGVHRYLFLPAERSMVLVTLGWELFNFVLVLATLGALLERRQRRHSSRVPVEAPAELINDAQHMPCVLRDVSVGGARLRISTAQAALLTKGKPFELQVNNAILGKRSAFSVALRNTSPVSMNAHDVGVEFVHRTPEEHVEKVVFMYGDSDRWRQFLQRREKHIGIWGSTKILLQLGATHSVHHIKALRHAMWQGLLAQVDRLRWPRAVPKLPVKVAPATEEFQQAV
jgi:cellulose synthase (UDP-forming)